MTHLARTIILRASAALLALAPAIARGQLAERPLLIEARVLKAPTVASLSDGAFLVYELHVTNFEGRELTWTGLEIIDATSGATVFSLADTALAREMTRLGATGSQLTLQKPSATCFWPASLCVPLRAARGRPTAQRDPASPNDDR